MKHKIFNLVIIFSLIVPMIFSPRAFARSTSNAIPPEMHSPAVIQSWVDFLYERVSIIGVTPPSAARVYGYVTIALYEAVAAGTDELPSLHGHLNEMPQMPVADESLVFDWPAVANAAAATVAEALLLASPVRTMFNTMHTEHVRNRVMAQRRQIEEDRQAIVDTDVFQNSTTLGNAIGRAIVSWAESDGFVPIDHLLYEIPEGEEAFWVPVPRNAVPIEPYWGTLRPLLLSSGAECQVPLAIEFSSDITSPFYRQAMELYQISIKLTETEREIADFWEDRAGEAGMHPGHWLLIAGQLIDQQRLTLAEAAKMIMVTGIAIHDSGIVAWAGKYEHLVMRPETYIQRYIDPHWLPFLNTPNFPEYPSGHATFGAAAAEVLSGIWGTMALTDHGGIVAGMGRSRSFTSLEAAAYENALSRLYGGVHYRMSMDAGMRSGECVGQAILSELHMFAHVQENEK